MHGIKKITDMNLKEVLSRFDYFVYVPFFLVELIIFIMFIKQVHTYLSHQDESFTTDKSFRFLKICGILNLLAGLYFTFDWSLLNYVLAIEYPEIESTIIVGHSDTFALAIFAMTIILLYFGRLYICFDNTMLSIKDRICLMKYFKIIITCSMISWTVAWIDINLQFGYVYITWSIGCALTIIVSLSVLIIFIRNLMTLVAMSQERLDTQDIINTRRDTHAQTGTRIQMTTRTSQKTSKTQKTEKTERTQARQSKITQQRTSEIADFAEIGLPRALSERQRPLVRIATKQTVLMSVDALTATFIGIINVLFYRSVIIWFGALLAVNIASLNVWLSFIFSQKQYQCMCCLCDKCCHRLCRFVAIREVMKQIKRQSMAMHRQDSAAPMDKSSIEIVDDEEYQGPT